MQWYTTSSSQRLCRLYFRSSTFCPNSHIIVSGHALVIRAQGTDKFDVRLLLMSFIVSGLSSLISTHHQPSKIAGAGLFCVQCPACSYTNALSMRMVPNRVD